MGTPFFEISYYFTAEKNGVTFSTDEKKQGCRPVFSR